VEQTARPIGEVRSTGRTILLSIITLGIYTFFWTYWTFDDLQRYRREGLGGALGLVIYLLCFFLGFIATVVTGVLFWSEIQALYEEDGRESPHTPLWGLWLLLPIVGAFVWYIPTQRALNEFWISKGAPAG
jgi:Domain of unknown function (DUF4234)